MVELITSKQDLSVSTFDGKCMFIQNMCTAIQ